MSETETETETEAAAPPPPTSRVPADKSEAQQKLDRGLATCNRYNDLRRRLEAVVELIAQGRISREAPQPGPPPAPAKSLFEGLDMVDGGHKLVADELERTIVILEGLF